MIARALIGLLLLAMAAGQSADLDRFREALGGYDLLGPVEPAAAIAIPLAEALAGLGILAALRTAGAAGLTIAVFWSVLATQAFWRGLSLENCGCFGAYLAQELHWWVLLEDVEFVVLGWFAAARTGLPLPLPSLRNTPLTRAQSRLKSRWL